MQVKMNNIRKVEENNSCNILIQVEEDKSHFS